MFVLGDEEIEAGAGEIVVIPSGVPHRFVNSGDGPLRQIDIHVSPRFSTEWL
jgi:mannose-6-phosphate isomerase-like protein (cupin superfamily)